jgi:hypothetical protein
MRKLVLLLVVSLAACQTTLNNDITKPVESNLSPIASVSIEIAQRRGQQIFVKDIYAATAIDLLTEGGKFANARVKGWLTEIDNDLPKTYFIGGEFPDYKIIYEVHFYDGQTPELVKASSISQGLMNKFRVRQLALQSIEAPCTQNLNSVVLEDDTNYIVYGLAASSAPDKIVIGGHYRFTYSKTDLKLKSKERLSNGCLTLNNVIGGIPMVTHLVTDSPLEIHAYLSKLHGKIFIGTKSGLYIAHEGKLHLLEKKLPED